MLDPAEVRDQVRRALDEDHRGSDLTSLAVLPESQACRAEVVAREPGVLCGLELAEAVFSALDPGVRLTPRVSDGELMERGSRVLGVEGLARPLLGAERTALNFLQLLSGIASRTRELAELVAPYGVVLLDTRKTLPGLRALEKYATRVGGARNHRMGLFDSVLIKDNHAALAGGPVEALRRAMDTVPAAHVEVEVDSPEQLAEVLELGPGRVLLDNFTPPQVGAAVRLVSGRCQLEVSGGVSRDNIRAYAAARPDYISVGQLTHSPRALDLALEVVGQELTPGRAPRSRPGGRRPAPGPA